MKISRSASTPARPPLSSAGRVSTIVYLVLLGLVTLLLAVVTLLLLLGLVTDPSGSASQIPVILIGLAMTAGGSWVIFRKLRRLTAGS